MNIQTRGERNNNPGNIERNSTMWQGMSDAQPDSRFVKFDEPAYGIRALAKIMLTYYHKYGYVTVQQIIDRWAPPEENDTSAYVAHVADVLGVEPDKPFNVDSPANLELLVKAIIAHENGRIAYDDKTIQDGIDMALA